MFLLRVHSSRQSGCWRPFISMNLLLKRTFYHAWPGRVNHFPSNNNKTKASRCVNWRNLGGNLLTYVCASFCSSAPLQDIQSLWLTSWLSSGGGRTKRRIGGGGGGFEIGGQEKRPVNVYTLQQPHKFPLQLDVYGGGNCSRQELDRIHQPSTGVATAVPRQESTLFQTKSRRQLRQSGDSSRTTSSTAAEQIYETKFIESSMGKATKKPSIPVSQHPNIPPSQHPSIPVPISNTPKPTETITITRQQ